MSPSVRPAPDVDVDATPLPPESERAVAVAVAVLLALSPRRAVPPLGHLQALDTWIDEDLFQYAEI